MNKSELYDKLEKDLDIARGAMIELISHNRKINAGLVEQMGEDDYSLLEEYTLLTKGILDAAKLLTDINSQTPKTVKEIETISEPKQKLDLDKLLEGSE